MRDDEKRYEFTVDLLEDWQLVATVLWEALSHLSEHPKTMVSGDEQVDMAMAIYEAAVEHRGPKPEGSPEKFVSDAGDLWIYDPEKGWVDNE